MSQTIDELARRVADASMAVEIIDNAIGRHIRATPEREKNLAYYDAISELQCAKYAAQKVLDAAVREYRARVEAAAFLARPEVRRPLEKLGEMEERQ